MIFSNKNIFLWLTTAVLFYSCIPEDILTNVDPAESKLVISSQIIPGNVMLVIVTRSFSALAGNEDSLSQNFLNSILVRDAKVVISWNDKVETLDPIDGADGLYLSNAQLDLDATELRLDVYDPLTNDSVYAITEILPRISLDSVLYAEEIEESDTTQSIYFSFADPQQRDNWYVFQAFDPATYVDGFTNNPFELINGMNGVVFEDLISDQVFDSTHYVGEAKFFEERIKSDTVAFFFSNISEEYFRFLDARQRTGSIISSAGNEPINHPTNVIGGLGYFNANNPSVVFVIKN